MKTFLVAASLVVSLLFSAPATADMPVPVSTTSDPFLSNVEKVVIWVSSPIDRDTPAEKQIAADFRERVKNDAVKYAQGELGAGFQVLTTNDFKITPGKRIEDDSALVIHLQISQKYAKINNSDAYFGSIQTTLKRDVSSLVTECHSSLDNSLFPTIVQSESSTTFVQNLSEASRDALKIVISEIKRNR